MNTYSDQYLNQDEEITDDSIETDLSNLVVYSRDWTIETIVNQIKKENIDLDPKFQRRNAWNDEKKSKLIESLIIGIPVPEIVLAEHPKKKKSFIVIDGKQRLLTIAGFIFPDKYDYWKDKKLRKLTILTNLNDLRYEDIDNKPEFEDKNREFLNADMRCTVISNYSSDDVLYDIFYRLNTGSSPLSSQELRQALNKGPFADYLIDTTTEKQPVHDILDDQRLQDIEIILRFLSIVFFGEGYTGNLKPFLDTSMDNITKNWAQYEDKIKQKYDEFNISINRLKTIFGDNIGRKLTDNKWARVNKALFEVEVYYFMFLKDEQLEGIDKEDFRNKFEKLCTENLPFKKATTYNTNTLENYKTRFNEFRNFINDFFSMSIDETPLPK